VQLREIELTAATFEQAHERLAATHSMPVIDACVPQKYALADASRGVVLTGEGGDALLGGARHNAMVYAAGRPGSGSPGRHYALAHRRWFPVLGGLMRRGAELSQFVVDHLDGLLARYPGDLVRRLFYMDVHVRAASLVFPQSYHACRSRGVIARHPYAGLGVYRTAFSLSDELKYVYPRGKLALRALDPGRPAAPVVDRAELGAVLPLRHYLLSFERRKRRLAPLLESGLCNENYLRGAARWEREQSGRSPYALLTLSEWIGRHSPCAPGEARRMDARSGAGVPA
jgi:asparagine synthetase B (glutamine-hydrolysing)